MRLRRHPAVVAGLRIAGLLSLAAGIVGMIVPVLPTTPFLLLSAACWLQSWPRLHRWLHRNRVFGPWLHRYRQGLGMSAASKAGTIGLLWLSMGCSAIVFIPDRLWWVRLLMAAIATAVTIHLQRIPTWRKAPSPRRETLTEPEHVPYPVGHEQQR